VCDHYRSFKQRSEWLRKDLILVDELETYEKRLMAEWKTERAFLNENLTENSDEMEEQKAGKDLYRWSQKLNLYVRQDCTEQIIVRGSFHILADNLRVGWHPRYEELCAPQDDTKKEKEHKS
jgi:hypothetical protein